MKTLMEEYCYNQLKEAKTGEITKTGFVASTIGGGLIGMGAYIGYKKYKQAKMKADMEKDQSRKNKLNARANQLKQDANKKKIEQQKKERIQNQLQRVSMQQQG